MDNLPWFIVVLHLLGATGFAAVVTLGLITKPVRDLWDHVFRNFPMWSKLLHCAMCFGVWCGCAWGTVALERQRLPRVVADVHDVLAFGFTVSLLGFLIALADNSAEGFSKIGKTVIRQPKAPIFRKH